MSKQMSSSRAWCFTYNNPTMSKEDLMKLILDTYKVNYVIIGDEVAPSTGTQHYQGYVYFSCAKHLHQIIKKFPLIHFIIARGTGQQNKIYCSKDGNFIEEGEVPTQGTRTDLWTVKDMIDGGATMREIEDSVVNLQALQYAKIYMTNHEEKRKWATKVWWYWGPPGTGKTVAAYNEFDNDENLIWESGKDLKFWDGYDGHPYVIFDDFREAQCELSDLLRILGEKPYRVDIKGTKRQLRAKHIIITCPYHPNELYKYTGKPEDCRQLLRRIEKIEKFTKSWTETEVEGNNIPPLLTDTPIENHAW